jgi:hypothetical protein
MSLPDLSAIQQSSQPRGIVVGVILICCGNMLICPADRKPVQCQSCQQWHFTVQLLCGQVPPQVVIPRPNPPDIAGMLAAQNIKRIIGDANGTSDEPKVAVNE